MTAPTDRHRHRPALLTRLGVTVGDLTAAEPHRATPTFADYLPVVEAATSVPTVPVVLRDCPVGGA